MKVIYYKNDTNPVEGPTGIGLGNFDGLHIGHMALVNTLIAESRLYGFDSMIYMFTKHPEHILRKKLLTPLLTTESKKIEILNETSLDYLYFDEFDENFSRLTPGMFVRDILVKRLKIRLAVAGFDYRFGYKGEGTTQLLEKMGKQYNFKVIVIPPIKIDNEIVSSTLIRSCVAKGDMGRVFTLLGRHHSITGEVQSGKRVGSKIGFPTANIHPENYLILPHHGVYITKTLLDGILYPSVTNIGNNPTFYEDNPTSIETHILDFDTDIYQKKIEVFFLSKIRGERKFKSRDDLVGQIGEDILATRRFFDHEKT